MINISFSYITSPHDTLHKDFKDFRTVRYQECEFGLEGMIEIGSSLADKILSNIMRKKKTVVPLQKRS